MCTNYLRSAAYGGKFKGPKKVNHDRPEEGEAFHSFGWFG